MSESRCPLCGSQDFYVKDSVDEYELHEFTIEKGEIVFSCECDESEQPEIGSGSSIHCNRCAWHGVMENILK
ncbi:MAG: hypothetical protein AB7W37_11035 [Syntrophobacteraceae bacterium]